MDLQGKNELFWYINSKLIYI